MGVCSHSSCSGTARAEEGRLRGRVFVCMNEALWEGPARLLLGSPCACQLAKVAILPPSSRGGPRNGLTVVS